MAIPVLESATETQQPTNSTAPVYNMPTTRPDGDAYIILMVKDGGTDFSVIPDHMTPVRSSLVGSALRVNILQWIGGEEPASYSLTTDNQNSCAIVLRVSGVRLSEIWDAIAGLSTANTAADHPAPAATTCLLYTSPSPRDRS